MNIETKKSLEPIIIHRLKVGGYTITHQSHDGSFWVTNSDGEGMQTTSEKLEKLIADFFYDEF